MRSRLTELTLRAPAWLHGFFTGQLGERACDIDGDRRMLLTGGLAAAFVAAGGLSSPAEAESIRPHWPRHGGYYGRRRYSRDDYRDDYADYYRDDDVDDYLDDDDADEYLDYAPDNYRPGLYFGAPGFHLVF